MRHAEFREQDLCVGSGVVEAGCKTVVGERCKRSGMHWTVDGANAMLALRSCVLSGRYEDFGGAVPRRPERFCHKSDVPPCSALTTARWSRPTWLATSTSSCSDSTASTRGVPGMVFFRVLELAVAHVPERYHDLIATRWPRKVPPTPPCRCGHPPSLARPPANRPWRAGRSIDSGYRLRLSFGQIKYQGVQGDSH